MADKAGTTKPAALSPEFIAWFDTVISHNKTVSTAALDKVILDRQNLRLSASETAREPRCLSEGTVPIVPDHLRARA